MYLPSYVLSIYLGMKKLTAVLYCVIGFYTYTHTLALDSESEKN